MNHYEADMQLQADAAKERLGIRWHEGLRFFERSMDESPRWLLASRHWPHILTWSWFIDYSPPRKPRIWGFNRWSHNSGNGWWLSLGFLGRLSFHRQTTDWMVRQEYIIVNAVSDELH